MRKVNILGTVGIKNNCNGTAAFARDVIDGLRLNGCDAVFFSPGMISGGSVIQVLLGKVKRRLSHAAVKYKISFIFVVLLQIEFFNFFRDLAKRKLQGVFLCNDVLSAQVALLLTKKNVTLVTHFAIPPWDEFVRGGFIVKNSLGYFILKRWMLHVFSNKRLRFIFISEATKKVVCQFLPNASARGKLIYNGIAVKQTNSVLEALADKKYIVNVGSVCPNKNQELFLSVAELLNKKLPDLYYVLVGDGNSAYVDFLKTQLSNKQFSERVIFTGSLSQRETYAVMSSAEMYFHTSKSESFGRVLVEAMGYDTVTCCMEYPAAHEIIGSDMELLFPITDTPVQVANKIYKLLSNAPLLIKKKKEQNMIFSERFTVDIMINDIASYIF